MFATLAACVVLLLTQNICLGVDLPPLYPQGSVIPKSLPVDLVADPLLKKIDTSLDSLEFRESGHLLTLQTLTDEANQNVDYTRKVNNEFERYEFEQKLQGDRLDLLEEKIALLQALRDKVIYLQTAANSINDEINLVWYPARRQIKADLYTLANEDRVLNKVIRETRQRVPEKRVDELNEKTCDNLRQLNVLKRANNRLARAANAQNGDSRRQVVLPHSEKYASNYTAFPPYLTTPDAYQQNLVGFRAVKKESDEPNYGYSSIYFGVITNIDRDGVEVHGIDMSSGNWEVNAISVVGGEIDFSDPVPGLK